MGVDGASAIGERIALPAVIVLIGCAGSGKSTWADRAFGSRHVVSSDAMRAVVGEHESDQTASAAAFDLVHRAVDHRVAATLTTVVDTTGLEAGHRHRWRDAARAGGLRAVAVVFDVPAAVAKRRIAQRDRKVPGAVVDRQARAVRALRPSLEDEGWDQVVVVDDRSAPPAPVPAALAAPSAAEAAATRAPGRLRFGLHVSRFDVLADGAEETSAADALAALARTAEDVGFDSIHVLDHVLQIPQVGRRWDPILDPFLALGAMAGATTRVRLGPLVAGVTHRPVPVLAKAIATLDVLSGGRARCGIGAGWWAEEHAALGIAFPPARARLRLLEDAVQALPRLWGPGTRAFTGDVLSLPETTSYPRPVQERIPLLVGGQGERHTLRIAAAHADACNLFGPPETVAAKRDVLLGHARDVDRDPAEIAITHLAAALVGADVDAVARLVDAHGPVRRVDAWRARARVGTVADHVAAYGALADVGVTEAIVAPEVLRQPSDLEVFADVIGAFA